MKVNHPSLKTCVFPWTVVGCFKFRQGDVSCREIHLHCKNSNILRSRLRHDYHFQLSDAKRKLARVCTAQLMIQIAKRSKVSRLSSIIWKVLQYCFAMTLKMWYGRPIYAVIFFLWRKYLLRRCHFHFTLHFRRDVKQFIFVVSEPHVPRIGVENRSSIILSYSVDICPHLNNLYVNATQRCLREEGN